MSDEQEGVLLPNRLWDILPGKHAIRKVWEIAGYPNMNTLSELMIRMGGTPTLGAMPQSPNDQDLVTYATVYTYPIEREFLRDRSICVPEQISWQSARELALQQDVPVVSFFLDRENAVSVPALMLVEGSRRTRVKINQVFYDEGGELAYCPHRFLCVNRAENLTLDQLYHEIKTEIATF